MRIKAKKRDPHCQLFKRKNKDKFVAISDPIIPIFKRRIPKSVARPSKILDVLQEMVFLYTTNYKIKWANKTAYEYFKLSKKRRRRSFCYELWEVDKNNCKKCPMTRTFKDGKFYTDILETRDKKIWSVKTFPVLNKKNVLVGGIETRIDITSQEILKYERITALQKIEDNLISFTTLVDGIRNPLTIILGVTELNIIGEINEKIREQTDKIVKLIERIEDSMSDSRRFLKEIKQSIRN